MTSSQFLRQAGAMAGYFRPQGAGGEGLEHAAALPLATLLPRQPCDRRLQGRVMIRDMGIVRHLVVQIATELEQIESDNS